MITTVKTRASVLVVMMIALAAHVSAQRQPNLNIAHYWGKAEHLITFIKDNDAIVIDGNTGTYFMQWRITNNGAMPNDTIAVSDTVRIQTPWTTYKIQWGQGQFPNGMKQQDTIFITPETNPIVLPVPPGLPASADSVLTRWCDSVYFISGDVVNPAVEADVSDDTTCNMIYVTYWRTGIQEAIGGSGIILYPNPASAQLNIKLNSNIAPRAIQVVDGMGRIVYSGSLASIQYGKPVLSIDIAHLSPGLYLLLLETTAGKFTEKFYIKESEL